MCDCHWLLVRTLHQSDGRNPTLGSFKVWPAIPLNANSEFFFLREANLFERLFEKQSEIVRDSENLKESECREPRFVTWSIRIEIVKQCRVINKTNFWLWTLVMRPAMWKSHCEFNLFGYLFVHSLNGIHDCLCSTKLGVCVCVVLTLWTGGHTTVHDGVQTRRCIRTVNFTSAHLRTCWRDRNRREPGVKQEKSRKEKRANVCHHMPNSAPRRPIYRRKYLHLFTHTARN